MGWIERGKKRREKAQRDQGYDYAAGALLKGTETPESLDAYSFSSPYTAFDKGVRDAITDAVVKGLVKDDRL